MHEGFILVKPNWSILVGLKKSMVKLQPYGFILRKPLLQTGCMNAYPNNDWIGFLANRYTWIIPNKIKALSFAIFFKFQYRLFGSLKIF
ncbi:unnamed protein product [Blepharisma stoltei]|uniref:Uncharacterized protein n=1 Tax=Blepharisma stoltei TaxID=1481888 RepID=A0AAU9KC77_9CILI|nr:unnamed protein product [Blepharisma stoltei]